ncbi:MAG: hypothetical protein AMS22_08580 [Thiotrichales bacterium SG8_50]|nr:MAG: hypothetical protein AMS22_08580 [Thiotrichales bacterium SG8_50]
MSTDRCQSCPGCASEELVEIGKLPDSRWFAGTRLEEPLPGGWLCRCSTCGLKFRNPANVDVVNSQLYNNDTAATWVADDARADWDLIVRYVSEELPQGGKVLDFGCYTGGLLERLGARYQRFGIEVNRVASDIASKKIGRDLWPSIDEVPDELRFDVIIAADVIEHLTNPMSIIEQLTSRLCDSGVLIITTGDADNYLWNRFGANWWYCFYPEHIAFISENWLRHIARDASISVDRCESFCYKKLGLARRVSDRMQMYFYGVLPNVYLSLAKLFLKLAGRPDLQSLPGTGLSRDHLFIVLSRADRN